MTVHYFPLEHLETRYTGYLDRLIVAELERRQLEYFKYYTDSIPGKEPEAAHFFHFAESLAFRGDQISQFAERVGVGEVKQGDTLFVSDLLLPGMETIDYLDQVYELGLNVHGIVHAGSFCDADITRSFERRYAPYENAVLDRADRVFLGSEYIRDIMIERRLVDPEKLIVTGFELDPALPEPQEERTLEVVFTGRISPDKQPWLFDKLARRFPRGNHMPKFVKTVEEKLSRQEYYALLSRAKVVVSFALQETFGAGVREAVKLGCVPVVPNAQSYPEDFPEAYRFDTFDEAEHLVRRALSDDLPVPVIREYPDATSRWFE